MGLNTDVQIGAYAVANVHLEVRGRQGVGGARL